MKEQSKSTRIRQFIIDNVEKHSADITKFTANRFGLTTQAVQHHLKSLVSDGTLRPEGRTRARRYSLCVTHQFSTSFEIDGLQEDVPWQTLIKPKLIGASSDLIQTISYCFTEMLNNAIDHSNSPTVLISYQQTPANITINIDDFGVGIFRKIMTEFHLPDEVAAICELVKGKLTTDPTRHSGEGIFFTSRMCDYFSLLSGSLFFMHTDAGGDWLIEDVQSFTQGTHVKMGISLNSKRKVNDVFNEFASPEKFDHSFAKTKVPVSLLQYGSENLVSRSQAKRLLNRFDRFQEVILDFSGVDFIGQGFADEIFRVYRNSHPNVKLIPLNTTPNVQSMIDHVEHSSSPSSPQNP
ncbi:STAS-like domain-containing protein [Lacunimicrobium album]